MPVKQEIVYPVILECCQFVTDSFWENIFEDLAKAKPPHGAYISKDFLCCSYKKKEFSYKIERKDPQQLHDDIYKLLKFKLGLLSQKEKASKRLAFDNIDKQINDFRTSWSKIRKKNVKDLLIEQYVVRMKKKHQLSIQQSRYLLSIIFIAMVFKVINPVDINYENGMIINIEGIDFQKKEIKIERDIYNIEVNFSPQIVMDKKLLSDSWDKYLKDLKKLYSK